jgi:carbon monoxide dehydrogenase subunit G
MDFKGRYSIPAAPDVVFAALHDARILKDSIPGCESVEQVSAQEFRARAVVKIGPVKASFAGKVTLTPETPPTGFTHRVKLVGDGQGGPAGFARGQSDVLLAAENGGTVLTYDAHAVVGGRLAQVGQRLIDSAAKALADEFFAKFTQVMEAQHAASAPAAPTAGETPASPSSAAAPSDEGLSPQIWVVGLIGIIIILLVVFSIVL